MEFTDVFTFFFDLKQSKLKDSGLVFGFDRHHPKSQFGFFVCYSLYIISAVRQ